MEIADGSSSGLEPRDGPHDVNLLPAVGQICSIHRDGRLDVVWVDGSRATTYLHQLYVIADDVCIKLCLIEVQSF